MSWTPKRERKTAGSAGAPGSFNFKRTSQSSAMRARLQQTKEKAAAGGDGRPELPRSGSSPAVSRRSEAEDKASSTVVAKTEAQLAEERAKKERYLKSILASTSGEAEENKVMIAESKTEIIGASASPRRSVKMDAVNVATIEAPASASPRRKKDKSSIAVKAHQSLSPRTSAKKGAASPRKKLKHSVGDTSALIDTGDNPDEEVITWMPITFEKGFKPPPVQLFCVCPTIDSELVIFGGTNEDMTQFSNEVYTVALDAEKKKWQRRTCSGKQPPPLASSACVRTSSNTMMVIGGLYESSPTNDVWLLKLDSMTWSRAKTSGEALPPIYGHSATFVNMSGTPSVLVFGGCKGAANDTNGSIYLLDTTKMKWMKSDLPGAPSGRYYHCAQAIGEKVFVFGGTKDGEDSTNEFFCMDTKRYAWYRMSNMGGPCARMKHVCSDLGGDLIVHGGIDRSNQPRKDCYRYVVKDKVWKELHYNGMSATERSGHGCHAIGDTVVLAGGAPFSASLDIHAFVAGVKEIQDVKAKQAAAANNPYLEQQKKQLAALQENVDYKKKYYEIYSIFLELQEISKRKEKKEGDEEGTESVELLELLRKKIDAGFVKLNKTHEEQQRRVMDVAALSSQLASSGKEDEPKKKKRPKSYRRSMLGLPSGMLDFKSSSEMEGSHEPVVEMAPREPTEEEKAEMARREEEAKRKKEEEEEEKRKLAEKIANETPEEKNERFRQKVLAELLATEEDHVRDLNIIIDVFVKGQHNLNPHEVLSLFGNLESILPVNQQLLTGLREVVKVPPEEQRVGVLFQEIADYLKMYAAYCAQQNKSLDTLTLLRKHNPAFAVFLQMCQADARCRKLDLESFLIKPMQRICRYPLLLKELLKRTPETHVDHEELKVALEKIQQVVGVVNEKKRECENQEQVMTIQLSMVWAGDPYFLATPTRRFIKMDTVHRVDGAKKSKMELMLFNDLILIAKRKGEKLYERAVIDINGCILWNLKEPKCAFCIRRGDGEDKHSVHNIVVASEAVKAEWMEAITNAITNVMFKGGEALSGKRLDELVGKQ